MIRANPTTVTTNPFSPNAAHMNSSKRMYTQNSSGMIVTKRNIYSSHLRCDVRTFFPRRGYSFLSEINGQPTSVWSKN